MKNRQATDNKSILSINCYILKRSSLRQFFAFIAPFWLTVSLTGQETKPLFIRGDQIQPPIVNQAPIATPEDESWNGKKFWFAPNPKTLRGLRIGFASSLLIDDLEDKALLYPTDIVEFSVVGIVSGTIPDRHKSTIMSKVDFYKVKFEDGSTGYLKRKDQAYKKSKPTAYPLPEILFNPTPYTTETFFLEDPRLMLKQLQLEQANSRTREHKQEAKRKAAAIAFNARGGVKIGMTKTQVLSSNWGKPSSINRTTTTNGEREQWVYGGNNYLYFDDGILTSIQN